MEIEADVETPLEDITHHVGADRKKATISAIGAFNKFLIVLRKQDPNLVLANFAEMTIADATPTLMGKFGDYLHRRCRTSGTAMGYLSAVKCELLRRFPRLEMEAFAGKWYKTLRSRIDRLFTEDCNQNGTRKKNSAPTMLESDLKALSVALLAKNQRETDKNRCLFTWQWQSIGRINEICHLRLQSLKDHTTREIKHAISLMINRTKTLVETDLLVFLHADTWEICPFHALATAIITSQPTDELFPQIPASDESGYVNRVLAQLLAELAAEDGADVEKLTEKLLSHSTRSGSATHANAHSGVQTSWVILRGGWTIDSLQTIFNYLCGNAKTDSKVGRALSGWASADHGGNCPSDDSFPNTEKKLFKKWADALMPTAPVQLRYSLTCSVLLWWNEMHQSFPQHALFGRMLDAGKGLRVTEETITRWVAVVKASFRRMNAPFLPVSEMDDGDSVPFRTIAGFMTKSVDTLNLVLNRVEALRDENSELKELLRVQSDQLNRMEGLLERIATGASMAVLNSPSAAPSTMTVTPAGEALSFGSPVPAVLDGVQTAVAGEDEEDASHLDMDVEVTWPTDLYGLSDVTVGGLFLQWYLSKLYLCKCSSLPSESVKKKFRMCKKMVEYTKLFLPAGVIIRAAPLADAEWELWKDELLKWSNSAEKRMQEFLMKHVHAAPVRDRGRSMNVSATYKRVGEVITAQKAAGSTMEALIVPAQVPRVIDEAWSE